MLVAGPARLLRVNCQELTTYEWSYLGDVVEDQQLHVEVLMDACQARQNA